MTQPRTDASGSGSPSRTPRSRTLGLGLLVLGAVGMVVTATVAWYRADGSSFDGAAVTGGVAQALGVAALAGSLLMVAVRSTGRRIVAVLVGLIAIVAAVTMPTQRPTRAEVITALRTHTLDDSYHLHLTGGSLGYATCCLLVVAGGAVVLARAHRWPQRADRFRRGSAPAGLVATGPDADPAAIWQSIDAGQDPTVDPTADRPAGTTASGPR